MIDMFLPDQKGPQKTTKGISLLTRGYYRVTSLMKVSFKAKRKYEQNQIINGCFAGVCTGLLTSGIRHVKGQNFS